MIRLRHWLQELACWLFGHRPLELRSHQPGLVRSSTRCARCSAPLGIPSVRPGQHPLPLARVAIRSEERR